MATKRQELIGNGCLARAAEDEPLFILRAHDKLAPGVVRRWAEDLGLQTTGDLEAAGRVRPKIEEALQLADNMETWQREHGCKIPD